MPKKQYHRDAVTAAVLVKKYIDDHPGTGISTADLARMINLRRNLLQEVFKFKFRKSIGQYKLQKRMDEARRLLKSGWSIKEVAFKMDYASPSSFTNAFRNHCKINPSEYLQEIRSNANKQG